MDGDIVYDLEYHFRKCRGRPYDEKEDRPTPKPDTAAVKPPVEKPVVTVEKPVKEIPKPDTAAVKPPVENRWLRLKNLSKKYPNRIPQL